MIPMVDLRAQYQALKPEIDAALAQVLESTQFILGANVQAFEREAADYLGVAHTIACASGTDALHLALRALGIGPGDEVITPAFTFIATAEAIAYVGATPVFADVDPASYNLDPAAVTAALSPRTRAILPVHLFGQPADMAALGAIAARHELLLIEDCAQSFGAHIDGRQSGAFGAAGCFSFFPSKNLGCFGDGGLISTSDDTTAEELRVLRNHGMRLRYHHEMIGYNSRLDEMQAAILRCKLPHIDDYNTNRRRVAAGYREGLAGSGLTIPHEDGIGRHVYHQYTLLAESGEQRERLMAALAAADIAAAIYYPIPLHRQQAFGGALDDCRLPVAEDLAARCFSLPIYPELTDRQVAQICDVLRGAL